MKRLSGFRMVHPAFPGKDVPVNHPPPFRGRGEGTRISNIQYSIFDIQYSIFKIHPVPAIFRAT